ncbi:hypothetical protein AYR62_03080 [Secundilactobacillus paracollinoides]|uniref:ATPase AAA-type core domain-containing protein n=1 Tax=Secundilactobacillus paracollinoides TaxID=240427 RepID=A0A1B2J1X5_9LACO|nr:ATP-binding protein [Secundilactobacillus paracollinoides]ANZ62385.1 hypothetical protein AYR61_14290 [Secundilactobacillus paracollinoides]ANZ63180.1 hypothetical protein AYR62_03080 [Secundilactobacillus paracollinoides]ANZ68336.1 hypothetical protein AYR63_15190 [Secundilactobacillus paracollinoides]KRL80131.1 hypothetical protein FC17_GL000011 [Secundilactobacillus paracollinoides DSM 15502 = JCM 11969]
MLVNFKVTNYRSFKGEQEFSMETGRHLSKFRDNNTITLKREKLLKSALLFGANANGKTNLIRALTMLKSLVLHPTPDEIQRLNTDTFGYNSDNTIFDIKFIENNNEYDYFLEYNAKEIVGENLTKNNQVVFSRRRQLVSEIPDQLKPIIDNLRKNQLLLYFAQQNNVTVAKEAYRWFVEDLILINTNAIQNTKFKALKNGKFKKKFIHFLQAADFNITDVEVREHPETVPNPSYILNKLNSEDTDEANMAETIQSSVLDVFCTHRSENGTFSVHFTNESTGTKVFMILALYFLSNSRKTLLIDEFDRSYHLELAEALIALINSEEQTNQFILTTHELSLMDCRLRQDQIWFAEKNQFGETELFSLFDFDDPALKRSDFNYKKRYLEGRYGATQIVNQGLLMEALKR